MSSMPSLRRAISLLRFWRIEHAQRRRNALLHSLPHSHQPEQVPPLEQTDTLLRHPWPHGWYRRLLLCLLQAPADSASAEVPVGQAAGVAAGANGTLWVACYDGQIKVFADR